MTTKQIKGVTMVQNCVVRPMTLSYVKFTGDNIAELFQFIVEDVFLDSETGNLFISRMDEHVEIKAGDYVVKDINGQFQVYNEMRFTNMFEC